MTLIDDQGRLFGRVNVIDAFVVVALLVAVGGGIVLFETSETKAEPTNYLTVALDEQPPAVVARVTTGDVSLSGEDARVTDVYVGHVSENATAYVRVAVSGHLQRGTVGGTYRAGTRVELVGAGFESTGTVLAVGASGTDVRTTNVTLTLSGTTSAAVASAIDAGDAATLGGRRLLTVRNVSVRRTSAATRRVTLTVALEARRTPTGLRFGARPLRRGATLPVTTPTYRFVGEITRVSER